ncbi:hypothetical protein [Paraburkholderia guartelaensis]|uniref:hypothetical protein n=1 Tax=Paraburkholderia guartelaensis TaxID=2546446 RepID=UPI002AB64712|nr:hypothetical protein [Paraburkholderia guartelaensis]
MERKTVRLTLDQTQPGLPLKPVSEHVGLSYGAGAAVPRLHRQASKAIADQAGADKADFHHCLQSLDCIRPSAHRVKTTSPRVRPSIISAIAARASVIGTTAPSSG